MQGWVLIDQVEGEGAIGVELRNMHAQPGCAERIQPLVEQRHEWVQILRSLEKRLDSLPGLRLHGAGVELRQLCLEFRRGLGSGHGLLAG